MRRRAHNSDETAAGIADQSAGERVGTSASVPQQPARRKSQVIAVLISVPVERISIHPDVHVIAKELGLQYHSHPWMGWLSLEGLLSLVAEHTIHVVAEKDRYLCFGGFVSYLALRDSSDPPAQIEVLVYQRVTPEMIRQCLLANDVVLPVAFRVRTRNWKGMAHWIKSTPNQYVRRLFASGNTLADLGRGMGYHPRSLAKGKAPKGRSTP